MHSRASQTLARAFRKRGVQRDLAKRTQISQATLSRLASGRGSAPTLETSRRLQADPLVPIELNWWREEPLAEDDTKKGAA